MINQFLEFGADVSTYFYYKSFESLTDTVLEKTDTELFRELLSGRGSLFPSFDTTPNHSKMNTILNSRILTK